jgi:hypothetical protein
MAYEPKPNTGSLFTNKWKKSQGHPDLKGDIYLDRALLKELATSQTGSMIKVSIAGWNKIGSSGDFVSLKFSAPYVKPDTKDEDIPF